MINLLIGRNNACKSTLLEAIYHSLGEFVGPRLVEAMRGRTNKSFSGRELWFDYDTSRAIRVSLGFPGLTLSVYLTFREEVFNRGLIDVDLAIGEEILESLFGGSNKLRVATYQSDFNSSSSTTMGIDHLAGTPPETQERIRTYIKGCRFIDVSAKRDVGATEELLASLKTNRKAKEFGDILYEMFGVGRNWEFLPELENRSGGEKREYRAATIENEKPLFLSGLGDGIRSAMQIIGNGLASSNTCLFIEEIENSQHPESLKKLIPSLVKIIKRNQLQAFITTHSRLVWRLFETEFETDIERDRSFRCFHVAKSPDCTVKCTPLSKTDEDEFYGAVDRDLWGG